jgi:hypothetical protein
LLNASVGQNSQSSPMIAKTPEDFLMNALPLRIRNVMVVALALVGIVRCPVHGRSMRGASVPIIYGYVMSLSPERPENRAEFYPNCDDAVLGGCVVMPAKTVRKNICEACNAARDAWRSNVGLEPWIRGRAAMSAMRSLRRRASGRR